MNKVLFISNKYPFPCDDGKKAVLAGFISYLIDRYGRENVLYVIIGKKNHTTVYDDVCRTLLISPPGRFTQIWNLFKGNLGFDKRSMQESLTYSPRILRTLLQLVKDTKPDLLILDTLRVGQFFWFPGTGDCRRILYMDDLFYLRFRRMLEVTEKNTEIQFDSVGTFSSFLPGFSKIMLRLSSIRNLLYKIEISKIKKRELDSPNRFDCSLLINPNEAQILKEKCPNRPVFSVKPLLYTKPCAIQRDFDGIPSFLVFGSLRHPVHKASVKRFLEYCMDGILEVMPEVKIKLVGEGADDEIMQLCQRFGRHVEIHGFIENIDLLFATSCALLVPLIATGGLKLKTLTALYYGLPIIATDSGVDGIPLQDGVHFIRENKLEFFPIHMKKLCDVSYNRKMSHNASLIFRQHYSKDCVYQEYDALFG